MHLLICDDEAVFLDNLQRHISEYMNNRFIQCTITSTTNPEDIYLNDECYDIAFLDIQMGEIDGISLAKVLRSRNRKTVLFFITNYRVYQDEAMDLMAFRYFDKPFDVERLYIGLDRAMEYIDKTCVDFYLYSNGAYRQVSANDILFIERENRKVLVHTTHEVLVVRSDFDSCCKKLPVLFFYGVHKSFYVNLHYVSKYSYSELYLTDGTRIPIASRRQAEFHKFWFKYLGRV